MEENTTRKPLNSVNTEKNPKDRFGLIPYIIAIVALIGYGFFIYFLTGKAQVVDPEWSRLIYLFSGVEAIVFAAAGFLFGREVNRKRAENAEEDKEQAQQEKKQVEIEKKQAEKQKEVAEKQVFDERKKGLMLGAMVIQEEKTSAAKPAENSALEAMAAKPGPVASIARTARSMYPELEDL